MSRSLEEIKSQLSKSDKTDNRQVITDFLLCEDGSVVLTALQEELLQRWNFADDLLRKQQYTDGEVAIFITKKYEKGIATAWRDIANARAVFASSRPVSKKYLFEAHRQRLDIMINECHRLGLYMEAAKLSREYSVAVDKLQDDNKTTPTAIIIHIGTADIARLHSEVMSPEDAIRNIENDLNGTIDVDPKNYSVEK